MDAEAALAELLADPPQLHWRRGEAQPWGIEEDLVRWLAENVDGSWTTLETGTGVSSIVFALRAANHTIVGPEKYTHAGVRKWCEEHGIPLDHVRSVIERSQDALPKMVDDGPLDLVLIDGAHRLPLPLIDWYYTAVRLRVGGSVVIDDMHIRACALLHDFLSSDPERWRHIAEPGRAAVFEKLDSDVFPRGRWSDQPWNQPEPETTTRADKIASGLRRAAGGLKRPTRG